MQSKTSPVLNFYLFSAVTLALGVLFIYWPVLFNLLNQLATDEDFSYLGPTHPVNYLLLKRAEASAPLLVYYWNIQQGHWLALGGNARLFKLLSIYQDLRDNRSDWALVRLITPVTTNKKSAENRLIDFAHQIVPVLPQFIREEPAVN